MTRFYSGGAEGFDLLCGALVLEVQRTRPQLQLMLVLPYTGHGEQFSKGDQRELARQKEAAEEIIYLSTHYFPWWRTRICASPTSPTPPAAPPRPWASPGRRG